MTSDEREDFLQWEGSGLHTGNTRLSGCRAVGTALQENSTISAEKQKSQGNLEQGEEQGMVRV